uniref:C-type lectin domain-containing protein n=1 Tax=Pygocentrus nattereri TaxID=42514 RepID=A0AAR2JCA2_PYGNA
MLENSRSVLPIEFLKHGANLASGHNNEENAFLKNLIKQATGSAIKPWLGSHDCVAVSEGKWLWTDGSKMSFQEWAKGQPDKYKSEHCLQMNLGGRHVYITTAWDTSFLFPSIIPVSGFTSAVQAFGPHLKGNELQMS